VCNYITQRNYFYLRDSVLRYASLLGKQPILDPGATPGEGIGNLYRELAGLVGDDVNVNIETEGGRLVFRLWNTYSWDGYNLLWLPVRFVEKLRTPLRRLAISFLHLVHKAGRFDTITGSVDMEMIMDWHGDADDWPEDERRDLLELMHSYREGRIHKLMERIRKCSYHRDLRASLAAFVPQGEYEHELVALMTEGLDVFVKGGPTIFDYCYHPFWDETNDDVPVTPDQTIRMIYAEDFLMSSLREWMNEESGNNGEIVPCAVLTLRPDGDTLFGKEEYPKVFFGYMSKLLDFLYANRHV
jgi:hypothetical protein